MAVKVLFPHHHDNQTSAARFQREALAIAHVRHPNVVQIFDVVQDAKGSFLVMEYVDGPALSQSRGHELDWQVVAALGCQVASALEVVHDHELVHRDVKPDNVVVETATGLAKLQDFGIPKDLGDSTHVTGPTGWWPRPGTPRLNRCRNAVGPWTDVYCLGLVLWELCIGRPAFQGPTEPSTALMRLTEGPPPISEWVDDVPDVLDAVVHRATRRDPHDRYVNGGAMAEALYELCGPRPHHLTQTLASQLARSRAVPPTTTAPWQ